MFHRRDRLAFQCLSGKEQQVLKRDQVPAKGKRHFTAEALGKSEQLFVGVFRAGQDMVYIHGGFKFVVFFQPLPDVAAQQESLALFPGQFILQESGGQIGWIPVQCSHEGDGCQGAFPGLRLRCRSVFKVLRNVALPGKPAGHLLISPALGRIARQKPAEQFFLSGIQIFGDRCRFGQNPFHNDAVAQAPERMLSCSNFQQDHAQSPPVGGTPHAAAVGFRRLVHGGAARLRKFLRHVRIQ